MSKSVILRAKHDPTDTLSSKTGLEMQKNVILCAQYSFSDRKESFQLLPNPRRYGKVERELV